MKAAPASTMMLATRHVSGEISGESCASVSAPSCSLSCLLSRNFIEPVFTYFSDKLKVREEELADAHASLRHKASLLRPCDNIFYLVLFHQCIRVRCACVDSLDLTLAVTILDAVRADVSGIAHDCAPPGQINWCVKGRRVQNGCARRSLSLNQLRKFYSICIENSELYRARHNPQEIKHAGER